MSSLGLSGMNLTEPQIYAQHEDGMRARRKSGRRTFACRVRILLMRPVDDSTIPTVPLSVLNARYFPS